MTLLLTVAITLAFAAIYALLLAMIGARTPHLLAALIGRPIASQRTGGAGFAASRRFSRA